MLTASGHTCKVHSVTFAKRTMTSAGACRRLFCLHKAGTQIQLRLDLLLSAGLHPALVQVCLQRYNLRLDSRIEVKAMT